MEFGRIVNTDDILKIKNKEKVLSDKIKKLKKLYNEIIQLQHIINHYGCNMVFLSECSNISNLKEDGNKFSSCKETCKNKESCDFYIINSLRLRSIHE